jgi:DNA-binding CsgD family transcriptional regulator
VTHADALANVAALADSPHERSLLILGEPGIGKSYVVESALERTATRVAAVRVNPGEMSFALAGLSSVISAVRESQTDDAGGSLALRSDTPDALFAAAHDVLDMLKGLALPPTLVLIDGVDRMDDESLVVLGLMVGRLSGTGVRVVATATQVDPEARLSAMPVIRLAPLTIEQTIELARLRAPDADPSSLRIVAGYVGGNPSILFEQLQQVQTGELAGARWLTLPPRSTPVLERVALPIVDSLGEVERSVLDAAVLAPLSHSAALSEQLSGAPDALEDLIAAAILIRRGEYVEVADPRTRLQVYWALDSQARRLHRVAMAASTAPHDDRLAAWYRSFDDHGPEAVRDLLTGAIWLVGEGRTREAVEYIERALSWSPRIERHADLLIRLCARLMRNGEMHLAARYSSRARPELSTPGQSMQLATIKVAARVMDTRVLDDEEVLTLIRLHSDANKDAAGLMLTLAMFFRSERWEVHEARTLLERTGQLVDGLSDVVREKVRAMSEILDALDGASIAPDMTEPVDVEKSPPDVLLMRGRALMWRERHAEARMIFMAVLNHPPGQDPVWSELATYARIGNEISAGDFRLARIAIRAWDDTSQWISGFTATSAYFHAWHAFSVGQVAEAEELIATCIEQAVEEAASGVHARALALRGRMKIVGGDLEGAITVFREVTDKSMRFRNPILLRHSADYVEVCVRTGRLTEANAAVETLERRHRERPSRWAELVLMRCRALVRTDATSIELFTAATEAFGRDESPYELGRTFVCLADRQDELGRDSRRTRMSAVTAFERAGADVWVAYLAAVAVATRIPDILDQLTDEERVVAGRLVLGQRTREIAEGLHVSVRTVELRLTRIYRTLGVRSRIELVALLDQ